MNSEKHATESLAVSHIQPARSAIQILSRLGPSPLAEDQLIRDLNTPASAVAPALVELELDGSITRAPGGLLSRAS